MPPRPTLLPDQGGPVNGQKDRNGQRFIDLHRMARDPVAQVDAPGQAGRNAVGLVTQPGEQAAPAADHDAQCERNDERPAGRAADVMPPFPYLYRDDPARQRARDAVGEDWEGGAQRVARSRRPCACRGPQPQAQEIARLGLAGQARDAGALMPIDPAPAEESGDPGENVPDMMEPGSGRNVDHAAALAWNSARAQRGCLLTHAAGVLTSMLIGLSAPSRQLCARSPRPWVWRGPSGTCPTNGPEWSRSRRFRHRPRSARPNNEPAWRRVETRHSA